MDESTMTESSTAQAAIWSRVEQCRLNAHAKSEKKRRDAFDALATLEREGKVITKAAVARRAGVSVVFLRSHPDMLQAIEARGRGGHSESSMAHNANATKDQIVAALRRRLDDLKRQLDDKDVLLRQKQREIDQLYGKLAMRRLAEE